MAEIVKITKGQPFVLYVPLVILNGDGSKEAVEAASISNTTVTISGGCEEMDMQYNSYLHYIVLSFGADMQVGEYSVVISATLSTGRPFNLRIKRAFGIVAWDWQSNWHQYLIDDHIELTDQAFIAGVFNTDADWEEMKEQLRQAIAEATAARQAADEARQEYADKAAALDGIARETTLSEGVKTIHNAIDTLIASLPTDYARQQTAEAIINIVSAIQRDLGVTASATQNVVNSQAQAIISNTNGQAVSVINIINAQAGNIANIIEAAKISILNNSNEHAVVFAKQGDNENATNTAILSAIGELVSSVECATDDEAASMAVGVISQ